MGTQGLYESENRVKKMDSKSMGMSFYVMKKNNTSSFWENEFSLFIVCLHLLSSKSNFEKNENSNRWPCNLWVNWLHTETMHLVIARCSNICYREIEVKWGFTFIPLEFSERWYSVRYFNTKTLFVRRVFNIS